MADRPQHFTNLEYLGDATQFSGQIHALIPNCAMLENFTAAEVRLLAHFMAVYRAAPGTEIIREGEGGDFMLIVVEGGIDVLKHDRWNAPQVIASVEPGRTLGEMSMIDGEPRFAACVATAPVLIAVLDRASLARIIVEQPMLGAKVLMALVLMLSQRLRATSTRLLEMLDQRTQRPPNLL